MKKIFVSKLGATSNGANVARNTILITLVAASIDTSDASARFSYAIRIVKPPSITTVSPVM